MRLIMTLGGLRNLFPIQISPERDKNYSCILRPETDMTKIKVSLIASFMKVQDIKSVVTCSSDNDERQKQIIDFSV